MPQFLAQAAYVCIQCACASLRRITKNLHQKNRSELVEVHEEVLHDAVPWELE
jgi:hypothetical protein